MMKTALYSSLTKTADPSATLIGIGKTLNNSKDQHPHMHSSFYKVAMDLLGEDFLIDSFIETCDKADITLVQAIEKKAFDQKVTREEIANYLLQGGMLGVIEKKALAVNSIVNKKRSELRKAASMGQAVAGTRANMGVGINAQVAAANQRPINNPVFNNPIEGTATAPMAGMPTPVPQAPMTKASALYKALSSPAKEGLKAAQKKLKSMRSKAFKTKASPNPSSQRGASVDPLFKSK